MLDVAAIRRECARVARHGRFVRVLEDDVARHAARLPELPPYPPPVATLPDADPEHAAAFHLACDAINFGSGWFPTLRKRAGSSGSMTVMLGLRDFFAAPGGGWTAVQLTRLAPAELAPVIGQDPGHPLVALYALHLRELGSRVLAAYEGRFSGLASRPGLAAELASWPGFRDVSSYAGRLVPFFKRAQLTAYDMVCAGLAAPGDEGVLTMFADNLVPHVLRVDGLLAYAPGLSARIEAGDPLLHGSREEVEIRACGLHAVELIVAARPDLSAPGVDQLLWHRGQEAHYKAVPRHRSRCEAY
ncbi:MAG: Hypothetical protein DUF2419 [uncultured Solirubrobacteraceae bacterium]|uniref:Queuosine 5'-phosphate N-glycosylase/hydrolase n=1 Tax=uncultured Solirubrobacteraceae bacterium TaxID=1162706 RepID=A0A6J4REK2_9ACTN|nr:MAG: Hypothetical protein DUF2419 [uncultured Solirubrobacteraceae bacterium]